MTALLTDDEFRMLNTVQVPHREMPDSIEKSHFIDQSDLTHRLQSMNATAPTDDIVHTIKLLSGLIGDAEHYYKAWKYEGMLTRLRGVIWSYNTNYQPSIREILLYLMEWDRIRYLTIKEFTFDDFKYALTVLPSLKPSHVTYEDGSTSNCLIGINVDIVCIGLHNKGWTDDEIRDELHDCYSHYDFNDMHRYIMDYANGADEYLMLRSHESENPPAAASYDTISKVFTDNKYLLARIIEVDDLTTDRTKVTDSECDYIDFIMRTCLHDAAPFNRNSTVAYNTGIVDNGMQAFIRNITIDCNVRMRALALDMISVFIKLDCNSEYNTEYDDNFEAERREHAGLVKAAENGYAFIIRDYPKEFASQWLTTHIDYNGLEVLEDER